MKTIFVGLLMCITVAIAQAADVAPDRKCIDQAMFARSVRIAMITGQKEDDVTKRVDQARKAFDLPDQEWELMKGWIHVVYASPNLSAKSPDQMYEYALKTCSAHIDS